MPELLNSWAIFVFSSVVGMYIFRGQYGFALWHLAIIFYLLYMQYWNWNRKKTNKDPESKS